MEPLKYGYLHLAHEQPPPKMTTRDRRIAWAIVAAVILVPVTVVAVNRVTRVEPVDVVRDYVTAITRRDVDAALALVAYGRLPEGVSASFLEPRAIADDWGLVSAQERERRDDHDAVVSVTLGGPEGTATGELLVSRSYKGPWRIDTPFVWIRAEPAPLTFVQVNQVAAPVGRSFGEHEFALFPGLYSIYTDLPDGLAAEERPPLLAIPQSGAGRTISSARDQYPVAPGRLTVTEPLLATVQKEIDAVLDDCVEFTTPRPHGCPFATDGEIDTTDGQRVVDPTDLAWRIVRYPTVALADDRPERLVGLRIVSADDGIVTLSGAGTTVDGESVRFTVECGVDVSRFRAVITLDGLATGVRLVEDPTRSYSYSYNTCYRDA